jgi:hypothetical protein
LSDLERGGLSVETGLDSKNAFKEAYAQAERDAAQEAGLIDEQPRDDQGRFTTEDAAPEYVAETPEVPEEETEAEPTAAETLLAGRYKSVEELERAHQELQRSRHGRAPRSGSSAPRSRRGWTSSRPASTRRSRPAPRSPQT